MHSDCTRLQVGKLSRPEGPEITDGRCCRCPHDQRVVHAARCHRPCDGRQVGGWHGVGPPRGQPGEGAHEVGARLMADGGKSGGKVGQLISVEFKS